MVRIKHRYLLVEFLFESSLPFSANAKSPTPTLNEGTVITIIRESLSSNFGDVGWSQVGSALNSQLSLLSRSILFDLKVVKYLSPTTRICIIRTSRSTENMVQGALTFIRQVKGADCCVRILHVGGTCCFSVVALAIIE